MCVICIKPKDKALPNKETIENMWDNNPHGAGIALTFNNKVYINKGFLNKEDFLKYLEEIRPYSEDYPMLLHFRIATHGGINQQCTHPFPIANDDALKNTQVQTDIAVAHNGIIKIDTDEEMSDTMAYITKVLYNLKEAYNDFYTHPSVLKAIEKSINSSKMAFLDKHGKIYKVGDWIEEDGIFYSNDSYKYSSIYSYGYLGDVIDLPEKEFCFTNAFATIEDKPIEDFPLFIDKDNRLYEFDEACGCMWEYTGDWITENGSPLDKFEESYAFVEAYIDTKKKDKIPEEKVS